MEKELFYGVPRVNLLYEESYRVGIVLFDGSERRLKFVLICCVSVDHCRVNIWLIIVLILALSILVIIARSLLVLWVHVSRCVSLILIRRVNERCSLSPVLIERCLLELPRWVRVRVGGEGTSTLCALVLKRFVVILPHIFSYLINDWIKVKNYLNLIINLFSKLG